MALAGTKTKYDRMFSPVTVRMFYDRLNRVFNFAKRERVYMGDNPCALVSWEILKNFPTWQPRERWLNQYDEDEETRLFSKLSSSISAICRILLNTGLRPPKEILLTEKEHVNLTDKMKRFKGEGKIHIIPPRALLVANGKGGTTRMVPLNSSARRVLEVLCGDETTGRWLFGRDSKPVGSIKKGFQRACERAGIDDLRPYDLRHTFATRLVERNVHVLIISELLGHSQPLQGFGHASRITPGYAHAMWDAMCRAVDSLEHEPGEMQSNAFEIKSGKSRANGAEEAAETAKAKVG